MKFVKLVRFTRTLLNLYEKLQLGLGHFQTSRTASKLCREIKT